MSRLNVDRMRRYRERTRSVTCATCRTYFAEKPEANTVAAFGLAGRWMSHMMLEHRAY